MKLLDAKIALTGVVLGCVCTVAGFGVSTVGWFDRSKWEPDARQDVSDYVPVTVWGWPLYAAVDDPTRGRRDSIDSLGELEGGRVALNFAFVTALLLYLRGIALVVVRRARMRQPIVATILSPIAVLLVVQLSVPLVTGEGMLSASTFAVGATLMAAPLMVVPGVPIAWALARWSRFGPGIAAGLGALVGMLAFTAGAGFPEEGTAGLLAITAAAGGACGLRFWAFSGFGGRPAISARDASAGIGRS